MVAQHTFIYRKECPLCGVGVENAKVARKLASFDVLNCLNCNFLYIDKAPDHESLNQYYMDNFASIKSKAGQTVNALVNKRVFARELRKSVDAAHALDVGCGYGFFTAHLQKVGWAAEGVELSIEEAEHAARLGLRVHQVPVEELEDRCRRYSLICAFEIIEHILEPISFLRDLMRLLQPEGRILLVTDNFESSIARRMGNRFPQWIPPIHVSFFSPRTLAYAAYRVGLEISWLRTYTPWALLMLERWKSLRQILSGKENRLNSYDWDWEKASTGRLRSRYRFFQSRRLLNPIWASRTLSRQSSGAKIAAVLRIKK